MHLKCARMQNTDCRVNHIININFVFPHANVTVRHVHVTAIHRQMLVCCKKKVVYLSCVSICVRTRSWKYLLQSQRQQRTYEGREEGSDEDEGGSYWRQEAPSTKEGELRNLHLQGAEAYSCFDGQLRGSTTPCTYTPNTSGSSGWSGSVTKDTSIN